MLDGSNQYACESCQCKVDAIRQMVLRTLPPYLCLQLNRFVFDLEVSVLMVLMPKCSYDPTIYRVLTPAFIMLVGDAH